MIGMSSVPFEDGALAEELEGGVRLSEGGGDVEIGESLSIGVVGRDEEGMTQGECPEILLGTSSTEASSTIGSVNN